MNKKDKAISFMESNLGKKIAKEFFLDYTTATKVSKKLYPKLWKKHFSKRGRKNGSWSVPYVNKFFNIWKDKKLGFMDNKKEKETIIQYGKRVKHTYTHYRLNLEPFFYSVNKKLKGKDKFTQEEKEIINYIFSFPQIRKRVCEKDSLFEGIKTVLIELFLIQEFMKGELLGYYLVRLFHLYKLKGLQEKGIKSISKKLKFTKENEINFHKLCKNQQHEITRKIAILIGFKNKGTPFYIDVIEEIMDVFPLDIAKQLQNPYESYQSHYLSFMKKRLNEKLK